MKTRVTAEEYRKSFIQSLNNDRVRNIVIEDTEFLVTICCEKVLSKLSDYANVWYPCLVIFDKKKKKPISNYYYKSIEARNEALQREINNFNKQKKMPRTGNKLFS